MQINFNRFKYYCFIFSRIMILKPKPEMPEQLILCLALYQCWDIKDLYTEV